MLKSFHVNCLVKDVNYHVLLASNHSQKVVASLKLVLQEQDKATPYYIYALKDFQ